MFAKLSCPQRPLALAKRGRRVVLLATGAALLAGGLPSAAMAGPDDVEVKSVFAMPISAKPTGDPVKDERYLCNPEPAGRYEYGTQVDFDPSQPVSDGVSYPGQPGYVPANAPSSASLVPALQAGASNDLCFGFTLTPNMQPWVVRESGGDYRLQAQPDALPDLPSTRVEVDSNNDSVGGDDMRNVAIDLPEGFVGDPDGRPTCSAEEFGLGNYKTANCPAQSQVGTAFVRATIITVSRLSNGSFFPLETHVRLGGKPNSTSGGSTIEGGEVYNLEHGPNELALLGIAIQPVSGVAPAKFTVRLQLNPDGSGRIRSVVEDAPRYTYVASSSNDNNVIRETGQPNPAAKPSPLYVESIAIRAWGAKADHTDGLMTKDFAEWGTDCSKPLSAAVDVETYAGVKSSGTSAPFTLTGCDALPFLPSVEVETAERAPAVPTATTVKVNLGQTTSGPRSALLKDAVVTLPQGLELGAQAGSGPNGLPLCSADQFGLSNAGSKSACPAASKVGNVTIVSPLQSRPFVGDVFLGPQSEVGALPALYIEVAPEGATAPDAPRIKLAGQASAGEDGRVTTTFTNVPQLRFSRLQIDFPGGPNALFTTPRACGTTTSTSKLTSRASDAPVSVDSSLTIDQDCATPALTPSFAMVPADPTAGASSPTTVSIGRPDRSPWLKDMRVSLPSGFLANLNAATECPAANAAAGACPASSRIATVATTAGVGSAPLTLMGQMFLAEREPGAVAGAVIVVPAKIGDIELGNVVVPARIDLRQTDAGLTLSTTAPTRFRNLPLNIRAIAVGLDRPGFPLNPSACGPLLAALDVTGDAGQAASATTHVGYTGCGNRPLQPGFEASLTGDTKPGGHPDLSVTLTPRAGDTNLQATVVKLPAGVSTDLKNLQVTCTMEQFNASACPANTRVGAVAARVSITPEVISGDVFLVRVPSSTLPGLGMVFTGRYAQRVLGTVKVGPDARISTAFAPIPDLPLTQLSLVVSGGPSGPIQLSPKACTADSSWDADFAGQGGQAAKASIPVPCAVPAKAPSTRWSRKSGLRLTFTAPDGQKLKAAKVYLPKGFKLSKLAKKTKYLKVSSKGGKVKFKRGKTAVTVSARGSGVTKIVVTIRPKAMKVPKKYRKKGLKKGAKISVKSRTVLDNDKVGTNTVKVKVK